MPITVEHSPSFAGYGQATFNAAQGMEDWTRLQELMGMFAPMAQENYQFGETMAQEEELAKMQLQIQQQQADLEAYQLEMERINEMNVAASDNPYNTWEYGAYNAWQPQYYSYPAVPTGSW